MRIMNTHPTAFLTLVSLLVVACAAPVAAADTEAFLAQVIAYNCFDAPETLPSKVQPLSEAYLIDGIRVTLLGAVVEGRRLAIGWTVENLHPDDLALIVFESVTIAGEPLNPYADFPLVSWAPRIFGLGGVHAVQNIFSGCAVGTFSADDGAGTLPVSLTFSVRRIASALVVVDRAFYDRYDDVSMQMGYVNMQECIRKYGVEVASPIALNPDDWVARGYAVVDSVGSLYLGDRFYWVNDLPVMRDLIGIAVPDGLRALDPTEETGRLTINLTIEGKD